LAIRADGSREAICALTETRLALDIFDVKHTSEANPSYCAEIAMYALMLANWLHHHSTLKDRFYVTMNAYLWTRFKQGDSELDRLERAGGATTPQLLDALVADSEDANLRFYLAAVRRFFEDVVRVIRIGDAAAGAWVNFEWHVSSTCGSCDWLGDKRHLSRDQRTTVDADPAHYCMPAASMSGHLCLVPGITRGARKILQSNAVPTTAALAGAAGHPALQQHTMLKPDFDTSRYICPDERRSSLLEVISIKDYYTFDTMGHRGLRRLHRNTGFTRFCRYLQINRDKLLCIPRLAARWADRALNFAN
jgi:hypothetical protein